MLNNIEKILYLVSFLVFSITRKYYTTKYRKVEIVKNRKKAIDIVLLSFSGIGMLIPLVYVFSPVFDFANYNRPFCLRYRHGKTSYIGETLSEINLEPKSTLFKKLI